MSHEHTTYPFIRNMKEMIVSYEEFHIKLLPNNFNQPTPQFWYKVYLDIIAQMCYKTSEEIAPLMASNDNGSFHYFHQRADAELTLIDKMNEMLGLCHFQGEPFNYNDLHKPTYPDKKRLFNILSCLLNYLRFQINLKTFYTKVTQENETEIIRKDALEAKLKETRGLYEEKRKQLEETKEVLQQRVKEERDAKRELAREFEHLSSTTSTSDKLNQQLNQRKTQLGEQEKRVEMLSARLQEAKSKIVQSPRKSKQKLADLKDTNEKLRSKKDERVVALRKKRDEGLHAEQMVTDCSDLLSLTRSIASVDNKEMKNKVRMMEGSAEEIRQLLNNKKEELQRKKNEEEKLHQEKIKWKKETAVEESELEELKASQQAEVERVQGEVEKANGEFGKMKDEFGSMDEEMEYMKQKSTECVIKLVEIMKKTGQAMIDAA